MKDRWQKKASEHLLSRLPCDRLLRYRASLYFPYCWVENYPAWLSYQWCRVNLVIYYLVYAYPYFLLSFIFSPDSCFSVILLSIKHCFMLCLLEIQAKIPVFAKNDQGLVLKYTGSFFCGRIIFHCRYISHLLYLFVDGTYDNYVTW